MKPPKRYNLKSNIYYLGSSIFYANNRVNWVLNQNLAACFTAKEIEEVKNQVPITNFKTIEV